MTLRDMLKKLGINSFDDPNMDLPLIIATPDGERGECRVEDAIEQYMDHRDNELYQFSGNPEDPNYWARENVIVIHRN